MSRTKEVGTAAGTLACALGIGFIMQSTEVAEQRYGKAVEIRESLERSEQSVAVKVNIEPVIDVQDITLTSALSPADADAAVRSLKSTVASVLAPPLSENVDIVRNSIKVAAAADDIATAPRLEAVACDVVATAKKLPHAFVELSVYAPCHHGQDISVHHSGMLFSERLDASGNLKVVAPALTDSAAFIFTLDDGEGAIAKTSVDGLRNVKRIVLQWQGESGFELHAREFGAEYGSEGHVWRNGVAAKKPIPEGNGGHLIELGNKDTNRSLLAEVYSFPIDAPDQSGAIDLSVEAEITKTNCGQEVEAQTLELRGTEGLKSQTIMLTIPSCDSVGDFLVLNNLLEDLKIAQR